MKKTQQVINHYLGRKDISPEQAKKLECYFENQKLNIMVVGGSGSGKSSTINAMFNTDVASVGLSPDPETLNATQYNFDQLVLWDTPGLGDTPENDIRHSKKITKLLNKKDEQEQYVIDLVLLILDGSSRDMHSSFTLLNDIIVPNLGENPEKRLIIAMNQADVACKQPNAWNYQNNQPSDKALAFLENKMKSIQKRIWNATDIQTFPIYYCAGYQSESHSTQPYNLSKILLRLIEQIPEQKRILLCEHRISKVKSNWESNDNKQDYVRKNRSLLSPSTLVQATVSAVGGIFGLVAC